MNLSEGLRKIWTEDREYQTYAIKNILQMVRGVENGAVDNLLNYLIADGMFYVPNDIYMSDIFGEEIKDINYGIYLGDICKLTYRLAMPVRLLDNSIVGFIGYSNKDDFNEGNEGFIKYLYPPKSVLKKSNYLYITRDEFKKAIEDNYICIVDGLFDQKSLEASGINAVSLCGSTLTDMHKLYLDRIKHKIVIADNDSAGRKLVKDIKRVWYDIVEIIQYDTKDIDSFLTTPSRILLLKNTIDQMKREGFILSHILN